MMVVTTSKLPNDALLQRYAADPENYTDCFFKDVRHGVSLADFVTAFYTTPLFRAERLVLRVAARRPSTDEDVAAIATDMASRFAAWEVEDRTPNQLLLTDMRGRTRSWFKVAPQGIGTRMFFGSAVVPCAGTVVRMMIPVHRVYSRLLLSSASVD